MTTDIIISILLIIFVFYAVRVMVLLIMVMSLSERCDVEIPPFKTILFEPFNYHTYIFFETEDEYQEYLSRRHDNGRWWKNND